MTLNLFPETAEFEFEADAPRGFSSPIDLLIETTEYGFEEDPFVVVEGEDSGIFPPPAMPSFGNWYAEVRDLNGGIIWTFDRALEGFKVAELHWELNGPGGGKLTIPILDPGLVSLFDPLGNVIDGMEVHVGRDDLGVMAHLVPAPRLNPRTAEIEGFGPFFHLSKKYVGRNNPAPELISNGHFDTDLTDWTAVGATVQNWGPYPGADGPGEIILTSAAAGNNYSEHAVIDVPSLPYASFIWLRGVIELDGAIDVRDLATSGRALWTVWKDSTDTTVIWQQGVSPNWRGTTDPQRLDTKIFVPANQDSKLHLRLYSPRGTVRYRAISAHREERLNCEGTPSTIISCLVSHAQNPGMNKTSVNLDVNNGRGEGTIELARRYKFAEAANIASACQEMASIQGGVDFLVETPADNDRTLFTMERTGWDPGAEKVSLLWGDNLNGWEVAWNPAKRADRGRVQGRGSGDEVTEAFYDDPDSNLGWEFVRRATIEGTNHPESQADGLGRTFKRPITITATVRRTPNFDVAANCRTSGGASGALLPGRLVDVSIDHGPVFVAEEFKIITTKLEPEAELATLELIPVSALVDE